jgi:hypothetical protein
MTLILIIIGFVGIDLFLFIKLFRLFYKRGEFNKERKYIYEPNILSLFDGSYWDNTIAKMKFLFYIFCCIVVTVAEILFLNYLDLI